MGKKKTVELMSLPRPKKDGKWSEAALRVLRERYQQKDAQGNLIETPEDMLWRVSRAIAEAERQWGYDDEALAETARIFYEEMVERRFIPNSPTLMNAGTESGLQYSACYVLPVEDSIPGIFEAIQHAAIVHQSGGGTGFSFSRLRPKGSNVLTSGGQASGPVSFMRVFDAATEAVKQGGRRRGANMGILRVDHPDILEFIESKLDGGITNFNISVGATDEFMEAVKKGEKYPLRAQPGWPAPDGSKYKGGEIIGWLDAREVFDRIVKSAWTSGDPGMVFLDRMNDGPSSPTPELHQVEATNPCVTEDTFVMTSEGPKQVRDLIGYGFKVLVNGEPWDTAEEGFFSTGVRKVYKITTREGFVLKATGDHPVKRVRRLTRDRIETEWVDVADVRLGDRLLLHDHRRVDSWAGDYGFGEGYLVGLLVGDGTVKKDKTVLSSWGDSRGPAEVRNAVLKYAMQMKHRADFSGWYRVAGRDEYRLSTAAIGRIAMEFGIVPGRKELNERIEKTSSEFHKGFLRGIFDADGSVQGSQEKGVSIRLSQSNLNTLQVVQRMLLRLGIFSRIYTDRRPSGEVMLPDGKGGSRLYRIKPQHELVISNENILRFAELVGFGDVEKQEKLEKLLSGYKRALNRERFVVEVEKIELYGEEEVYDLQVPGINAFDANGFYVHNCGEQPLYPNEACNLGSINLGLFVKDDIEWPGNPDTDIDWDALASTVHTAIRFLDDVIDVNPYPLPEIDEIVKANRRVGLGVMGWADMLFKLGIPYDSPEGIALADRVMGFINDEAIKETQRLAEERGPFPAWPQSIYRNDKPRRNATVTTIAPTGSISIIANASSGIEPLFALAYQHKVQQSDGFKRVLNIVNPVFEEVMKKLGYYSEELMKTVAKHGTLKHTDLPEEVKRVFKTAHEVTPEWHVNMQAAFQRHVENAVSKTVNLPNHATADDVAKVFMQAYDTGCMGITIYRDGSKNVQVLNAGVKEKQKEEKHEAEPPARPKPRPEALYGITYRKPTPLGTAFITINSDAADGEPFEVFMNVGKAGSDTAAVSEAIGRLISLILRLPSPVNQTRKLQFVVDQLFGIGGGRPVGFGNQRVKSLPDAVAQVLHDYLEKKEKGVLCTPEAESETDDTMTLFAIDMHKNGNGKGEQLPLALEPAETGAAGQEEETFKIGELCPVCGEPTLVLEEGCKKCYSCGYSECG